MRAWQALHVTVTVFSVLAAAAGCGSGTVLPLPDGDSNPDGNDGNTTAGDTGVVPDNAFCDPADAWEADWAAFERDVIALVNQQRAAGADCGSAGTFDPAPPLTAVPALHCAARIHSLDMNGRDFFDHTNPDGEGPKDRMDAAGYTGRTWGENIAFGFTTPEGVVAAWMNSPGHCANIMRASFTETGVGYHGSHHWTQTFGAP